MISDYATPETIAKFCKAIEPYKQPVTAAIELHIINPAILDRLHYAITDSFEIIQWLESLRGETLHFTAIEF